MIDPAPDTSASNSVNDLRRLHMRSWRRGMKEMDLILGRFSDENLADLSVPMLAQYESLLSENDQDLYLWVTARVRADRGEPLAADRIGPPELDAILTMVADHLANR